MSREVTSCKMIPIKRQLASLRPMVRMWRCRKGAPRFRGSRPSMEVTNDRQSSNFWLRPDWTGDRGAAHSRRPRGHRGAAERPKRSPKGSDVRARRRARPRRGHQGRARLGAVRGHNRLCLFRRPLARRLANSHQQFRRCLQSDRRADGVCRQSLHVRRPDNAAHRDDGAFLPRSQACGALCRDPGLDGRSGRR